jgi:ribosomal protein L21
MYAVINDSGTQIKVKAGDVIRVDLRNDNKAGDTVEFNSVALVSKDDALITSASQLKNSKVVGKVIKEVKSDRVITNHFKRKNHSRMVRKGHRQKYLEVKIETIVA